MSTYVFVKLFDSKYICKEERPTHNAVVIVDIVSGTAIPMLRIFNAYMIHEIDPKSNDATPNIDLFSMI